LGVPSAFLPHGHCAGSGFGTSPPVAPPAAAKTFPETIIINVKDNALNFFISRHLKIHSLILHGLWLGVDPEPLATSATMPATATPKEI
jgi:hypothetical protein